MLGFGDVVGEDGMFGRGWCGVGVLDMILCWGWELGVLAFPSVTNCNLCKWGMVSVPGLYFWHWVMAGSVRCALCLAGHGVGLLQCGWISVHVLVGAVGL